MQRIAGAIDHREAQHCSWERGIAQDYSLYRNLVVVVSDPREGALRHPQMFDIVGVQLPAHLRFLGERSWLRRAWLAAEQHSISTIDVLAADRDDALGEPVKSLHQCLGLAVVTQEKIDHYVRRQLLEAGAMRGQIVPIAVNSPDRFWKQRLGFAAMEHRHVMALLDEGFDREWSDEASAANDENPHYASFNATSIVASGSSSDNGASSNGTAP